MQHVAPHSPMFRLLRNVMLAWFVLSLIAVAAGILLGGYGAVAGCRDAGGGTDWLECVLMFSMLVPMALGSMITSAILLLFMQLFYMAGARVTQRPVYRTSIKQEVGTAIVEGVIDAID